jgi:hypothetical protein
MISIAYLAEKTGKKYHLLECRSREEELFMEEHIMTGAEIRAGRERRGLSRGKLEKLTGYPFNQLAFLEKGKDTHRNEARRKKIQQWFEENPVAEADSPEKIDPPTPLPKGGLREQKSIVNSGIANSQEAEEAEVASGQLTVDRAEAEKRKEQAKQPACTDAYCCPVCGQEHNPNYKYDGLKIYDECCSCGLRISYYMPEHECALSFLIEQLKGLSLQLDSMWRCRSK